MAKKKSKTKAARSITAASASPAPAPASPSKVMPITIGLVLLAVIVAWVWSRTPDRTQRPSRDLDAHAEAAPGPFDPRLLTPSALSERAPDTFAVELDTTAGDITIDVHRAWAPNGADRFYNLVRAGYYTDVAFFRVLTGFMAQCGIHGRPDVNTAWDDATIPDDPVVQHNTRGYVTFATAGPNTRTTQFFINFADNSRLDATGFSPFGLVRDMSAVDELHDGYGEGAPMGQGPDQGRMQDEGNAYLRANYPELDYIESARIVP